MSEQPEAFRLADILEKMPFGECDEQAAAELRRLHGEVAAMNQRADEIHKWYDVLLDRAEQAEAEVERLRVYAKRYRWLRDMNHWPACFDSYDAPEPIRGPCLDAAIDAALKEPK